MSWQYKLFIVIIVGIALAESLAIRHSAFVLDKLSISWHNLAVISYKYGCVEHGNLSCEPYKKDHDMYTTCMQSMIEVCAVKTNNFESDLNNIDAQIEKAFKNK